MKSALRTVDFRSYGEVSSREYLIGCKENEPDEVALGLITYTGRHGVPDPQDSTDSDYQGRLVQFARWLVSEGYNVRPIMGDTVDMPARKQLNRLLTDDMGPPNQAAVIDEPVTSVDSLLSALSRADFVVATRFHNILFALLSGKPVIAISPHHKCASLMDAVGLSEYCLDIHEVETNTLIRTFEHLVTNAEAIKAQIVQKTAECRSQLDDQCKQAFRQP